MADCRVQGVVTPPSSDHAVQGKTPRAFALKRPACPSRCLLLPHRGTTLLHRKGQLAALWHFKTCACGSKKLQQAPSTSLLGRHRGSCGGLLVAFAGRLRREGPLHVLRGIALGDLARGNKSGRGRAARQGSTPLKLLVFGTLGHLGNGLCNGLGVSGNREQMRSASITGWSGLSPC